MHVTFNYLSVIFALLTVIYLFITANKTKGELKKGLTFISVGILIALTTHSFFEFLESWGYLNAESLLHIMPILVVIGTIPLLYGTYIFYKLIKSKAK